ncbi:hypothetical protein [Streptomyces cavernicola]|uniref:Cytochrome c domain-containing protein n=1 Tax=Streptomyces cavernicola TaxID=3043613 RepID=A0ABT6S941_9ACTN|nr:hypothetical protein [Streptomyces sp. B-S-A6]MDI3404535.1 hypothetical protein [Streptomyces sp. B-S-A6]
MLLPPSREKTELLEVVRISDPAGALGSERLVGDDVAIWDGEDARRAMDLVDALPDGVKHRCFTPGWGLRAHSRTELLFEVAFCFRCHGARIWADGLPVERQFQDFDAESGVALELVRLFRGCGSS